MHLDEPGLEVFPLGHALQILDPGEEYLPAGHLWQLLAPSEGE